MSNSSSATTVIEIYDGYIDDENSKKSERFQPPYKFLFSGRIPEIGQRAEIHATAMSGHGCRLSGIVTHVGDLPTFDQWVTTTCIVPVPCDCFGQDPFSKLSPDTMMPFDPDCRLPQNHCFRCRLRKEGETEATFGTMMNRFHELEGTIHGQEITVFAYLNFDYYHCINKLPFRGDKIYKVILKANETKVCVWCVHSIEDVSHLSLRQIPKVFCAWELGHQNADAPQFQNFSEH